MMTSAVMLLALVCCLCLSVSAFRPGLHLRQTGSDARLRSTSPLARPLVGEIPAPLSTQQLQQVQQQQQQQQRLLRVVLPSLCLGLVGLAGLGVHPAAAAEAAPVMAALNMFETLKAQANDSGFLQAFLLIFISEIGDKTFFIAGLLAAKYGKFISFTGSIGALAVMTIISTALGQIFHAIPPSLTQGVPYDDIVAVAAFSYFGIKTLLDASQLEAGNNSGIEEEKAEAEEIVEELSQDERRRSIVAKLVQTFTLVFAAEIGDRSFLSTIALSAALNPYAVATGAIAAHASATGVAVAGGVLLSKYLSEKVIGYIGGSLFLIFAFTTAFGIF